MLEDVETARHATRASAGDVYGRVTIGFAGVLNHRALPPLTRAVRQRYPNIELTLLGRVMTRDAISQLESRRITPPGTVFVPLTGDATYMDHGIARSPQKMSPALAAVLEVADEILPILAD